MPNHKPWEHAKSSGSEADPLAARFVASLEVDRRLYDVDITGSTAHARMLHHVGLITADDLADIERGLLEIRGEIAEQGDAWPGWRIELEDVHMCIEAALIEKTDDAGRKLHTGRSRNDQVATDLRLWIQAAVTNLVSRFDALERAFLSLASRDGRIVMPSYTHLQRAQPIVVGGELLAWQEALQTAKNRTICLGTFWNSSPLGSGAIAGSSLPLSRQTAAEAMGFDEVDANSIDATASRDAAVDFVYALSMTAMTLSRWAEQWVLYASTEFGFITLDDRYTTGSSMMPQKQNPDMLELIRGKTATSYGSLIALLTLLKGLPIGYNRDLQEDKRHVFAAYDSVCDCLEMAAHIVETTRFNEEHIKRSLGRGFLDATSLAEYLVTRGVPFRTAHQIVGGLVRKCQNDGLGELRKLTIDQMNDLAAELAPRAADAETPAKPQAAGNPLAAGDPQAAWVGDDVYDWLGAENVVKRYQSYGNAGATGFEEQLKAWRKRLDR